MLLVMLKLVRVWFNCSFVKKVRMGKRIEKAFGRDKGQTSSQDNQDDDPNKTPGNNVMQKFI